VDQTLRLLREGYGWLPNQRRRTGRDVVHLRVLGRRAVSLCGPEAARFFYDEQHVRRHGVIPELVRSTLFGHDAVHTLDGPAHRIRKHMLLSLLTGPGVPELVDRAAAAWDAAIQSWSDLGMIVLFDEASRVLTSAVCEWAGIPLEDEEETSAVAADLRAMVDGFATLGPRHWRARRARARREAWLIRLIEDVRAERRVVPAGSVLEVIAWHREGGGQLLPARVAAVEVLNVLRPTVAVSWFIVFAAHALHRWPAYRNRLREGDPVFIEAFTHEVRRFYPFAPFVGGRAVKELSWWAERIPAGALILLDLYGQNHDARVWPHPYRFDPDRFIGRRIGAYDLIPQGGGDPATGHRCPGEEITVALLNTLVPRLAWLEYEVPEQDLTIPLNRIPTRPRSGFIIAGVRPAQRADTGEAVTGVPTAIGGKPPSSA